MIDPSTILEVGSVIFAGGAAWGGAKVALNGTKAKVQDISAELAKHMEDDNKIQTQVVDRLARIETKLDFIREAQKDE